MNMIMRKMMVSCFIFIASIGGGFDVSFAQAEGGAPSVSMEKDPCPNPRDALQNSPDDLSLLQEDITRFSLCLQRTQLLNRLNELTKENIETINSTLDQKLEGMAEKFSDIQVEEIMAQIPTMMDSQVPVSDGGDFNDMIAPMIAQPPSVVWTIDRIFGAGAALTAQLKSENGHVTHVRAKETLPETKLRVVSIAADAVKVSDDKGDIQFLEWSQ